METARHLVSVAAELTACMQDGEYDLDSGDLFLGMLIDGDTATVVPNGDRVVFADPNLDFAAVTRKRLVDGVVDNLVHEMMEAAGAGGADVHAGTHADRFETLQNLDVLARIMTGLSFCHALLLSASITCGPALETG